VSAASASASARLTTGWGAIASDLPSGAGRDTSRASKTRDACPGVAVTACSTRSARATTATAAASGGDWRIATKTANARGAIGPPNTAVCIASAASPTIGKRRGRGE